MLSITGSQLNLEIRIPLKILLAQEAISDRDNQNSPPQQELMQSMKLGRWLGKALPCFFISNKMSKSTPL